MPLNRLSLPDCPDPEAIRNVYTSRKTYAIAPFPILRWADFRSDLLGSVCVPLGVDDLAISEILRHSDVSVTRGSYIKRVGEKASEAMDGFEAELAKPTKSVKAPRADAVIPAGMA